MGEQKKSEPATKKPAPNKGGRPTKITKDLIQKIATVIRGGAYVETAAAMVGLNKSTFYDWLKKGSLEEEGLYREFSDAVERAMAESEVRDLMCIDQAANGRQAKYLYKRVPDGQGGYRDSDELVLDAEGSPILVAPATKPEWTAAAWRLERKFPKRWGRRIELVDGDGNAGADEMDHDAREKKIQEIMARRQARAHAAKSK